MSEKSSIEAISERPGFLLLAAVETAAPPWLETLWSDMLRQINGVLDFAAQAIDAVGEAQGQLFDITSNDPPESAADLQNFDPLINASLGLPFIPPPDAYNGTLVFNVPLQVSNQLSVSGVTQLNDLFVAGEFSITDLDVPGTASIGSLAAGGTQLGSLTVAGNTQLNTLSVSGPVSFNNLTAGNLSVTNAMTAAGTITAQGGITTGGANIDLQGGEIFASNIVNEIIAGDDIIITGPPNAPTISADVRVPSLGSRVRSLNSLNGAVTLEGGSGITVSESGDTITIATTAGLGTYLGLTDTPSTYLTHAIPFVNATGSALTQSPNLTFNGTQLTIGSTTPVTALTVAGALSLMGQEEARWYDPSNTNYVGLRASSTLAGNTVWTLPVADGDANDMLVTDGAGNLRFIDPAVFGGVTELDDLSDVTVVGPVADDILYFNGAEWVNASSGVLGLGDGTFLGLSDTPNSYTTNGLVFANGAGNALTQSNALTFNGTQLTIGTMAPLSMLTVDGDVSIADQQALRFYDLDSSHYVGFRASTTLTGNFVWTLPVSDGGSNEFLVTDGAGNLRFADAGSLGIVSELDDLSDVTLAATTAGDVLVFDGNQWVNQATSTLGLGDGTFLGLFDTPNSFTAGAILYANGAGTALTQSPNFTFNGTQVAIGSTAPLTTLTVDGDISLVDQQVLRWYDADSSHYVGFRASSTVAGNTVWTLPASDGAVNNFLITDGAGNLRFADLSVFGVVTALDDLSDVALSGTSTGDVLVFDGNEWVNQATSTLGLGDGTFLGLSDTPNSYTTNGLVFANGAGNALTQSNALTFNGTQLTIGTMAPLSMLTVDGDVSIADQQALRFYDLDSSHYVGFRAPASFTTNLVWVLPDGDGSTNQVLVTDGSGNLRFEDVSAIGGGASTFLGLNDTPSAYIAGAIPYASSTATELLFSSNLVFNGSRLGIGTNNPSHELTVHGSVYFGQNASNPGLVYQSNDNEVGIGTSNPVAKLNVESGSILQRGARSGTTYTPQPIASIDLPDTAYDVHVIGNRAYVVTGSAGRDFHIIDISNRNAPVEIGSLNLPANAYGVYVSGKYAYVTTDLVGNDFHVIDISNPRVPVEVGSLNLAAAATAVKVQGRYAYVTTESSSAGLSIIDIFDPTAPRIVGSVSLPSDANGVDVKGNLAYVVTDALSSGFFVIDVTNPTAPFVTGEFVLPTQANDVQVRGDYAFVVTEAPGDDFHIINISSSTAPTLQSSINLVTGATGVSVAGSYAYVSTGGTGNDLHVIDISNISSPIEVGSAELASGAALDLAVVGRYAYVVTSLTGDDFHVIDITGVEAQSVLAHSLESGNLSVLGDIVAAGNVSLEQGLRIGTQGIQTDGTLLIQGTGTSIFNGSIAIGTTSATHALTIDGDASISGSLYDSGNNAGAAGQVLVSTGVGQMWTATSSLGLASAFTTSAQLAALLSDETGTAGSLVFSTSPTFSGTVEVSALTVSSTLMLTGTSANLALGANYLSGDGDDEGIFVSSTGLVGIGTTSPFAALTVDGAIAASNLLGGAVNVSTDAQGNIIRDPSDGRLKTNVQPIENALEKVLALRGVRYEWIDTERFGDQTEIGFIAQEVDLVLPEVVRKGGDYWSLNTRNILAAVVEAIKEMWVVVTGNQEQIELLENRVEYLEHLLEVTPQTLPANAGHAADDDDDSDDDAHANEPDEDVADNQSSTTASSTVDTETAEADTDTTATTTDNNTPTDDTAVPTEADEVTEADPTSTVDDEDEDATETGAADEEPSASAGQENSA